MKTATLFCFVGAFMFVPTLGIIRFVTDNPTRTDEYANSDLRTMFNMIRADLSSGLHLNIEAPNGFFNPEPDTVLTVETSLIQEDNLWIDEETGLPYHYNIECQFWQMQLELGPIRLLGMMVEIGEDGWSVTLDLNIRIEDLYISSRVDGFGTWRLRSFVIQQGFFVGYLHNVDIHYRATIHSLRVNNEHILGPIIGQPMVTVNHLTAGGIRFFTAAFEPMIYWNRIFEPDGHHADDIMRDVMSRTLAGNPDSINQWVLRAFNRRPYRAPSMTQAMAAANVSGFSCRRSHERHQRESKLYN